MKVKKLFQQLLLLGSFTFITTSYAEDTDPPWSYEEQAKWSSLESLNSLAPIPGLYPYAECGLGQKQSPITIIDNDNRTVKNSNNMNGIRFAYHSTPLSVTNNGYAIIVNMPPSDNNKNAFKIGNQEYELSQIVIHSPSEHKIDGQSSKMEIQFEHSTPSGKLATVGVLVTQNSKGKDNSELQKILDNASHQTDVTVTPSNTNIKPFKLLPSNKKSIYTYAGSLTIPPCTGGVDWYVLRYPLEVSAAQITAFQTLYRDNFRVTQPLSGRVVEKNFK
jgi:carbonic anhydrase